MLVCIYEDRLQQIPGLKLLILSLSQFCPKWPILLRFPGAETALERWLANFKNVTLRREPLTVFGSYNVKPTVLLDGLSIQPECIWMDTDVLVNGDLAPLVQEPPTTLIVTQDPWEYASGSTHRCATWDLPVGRDLPGPLNSAVVRVTQQHKDLLLTWQSLLSRKGYLDEQKKPIADRNPHMLGDQDALAAAAASSQFADVPVRRLRHSAEILQHHGAGAFGLSQRYTNLRRGLPPLLHAMGSVKPWRSKDRPSLVRNFRDYYERTYLELSPYVHVARGYRSKLQEDDSWMNIQTMAARIGSMLAMGSPCLKGMAQAVIHDAIRQIRQRRSRLSSM